MRILCLSTWFPYPPDNGSKIRAYHLLRALGSAHQVTLVAFQPVGSDRTGPRLAGEGVIDRLVAVPADPFRYVKVPQVCKFSSPIPLAYWPCRLMQRTIAELARSNRWDRVVAIQVPVGRYALQLPETCRVLDVDTSLSYQMYERHTLQRRPLSRLQTWASWQKSQRYETRLLRRFHAGTVVSQVEVDFISSVVGDSECRITLIPNGVDCQHNRLGLMNPRPNTLIFNGALSYSANYDAMQYFLAEIYPRIQEQVPGVSLTITGSTADVDLTGLALDASVRLAGYVDDIRPEVAGAWVCVVPLRQGGGTRIKILEAMALGTPIVTTAKGAEGLDVTHCQDVLIADDPSDFAGQVIRLLHDTALRRQLVANARRVVEQHYDWAQIGHQFLRLVEDLAGGQAAERDG